MNPSIAKAIEIDIVLTGPRVSKNYRFFGKAYIDSGYLTGSMAPAECAASIREQVLLTAFTLTGCPVAARIVDDAVNPWRQTGGTYEASRTLLSDAFSASSKISAIATDTEVKMVLHVVVEGDLPNLIAVKESFSETIDPSGHPGELHGTFDLSFLVDGENHIVPASATTDYRLPGDIRSMPTQRNITIDVIPMGNTLCQIEQIDLYRDRDKAASDLTARRQVEKRIGSVMRLT